MSVRGTQPQKRLFVGMARFVANQQNNNCPEPCRGMQVVRIGAAVGVLFF